MGPGHPLKEPQPEGARCGRGRAGAARAGRGRAAARDVRSVIIGMRQSDVLFSIFLHTLIEQVFQHLLQV
jgi:hypothetical protein